jgi:hypothetical protein
MKLWYFWTRTKTSQDDIDHKLTTGNSNSDTGFNIEGTIDGSLKTFIENTGLHNILNTKHGDENVPPTRCPGSSVIDYVYVSEGLLKHVIGIGLS